MCVAAAALLPLPRLCYFPRVISITGTYQHGTVILDEPVNLPEGAHVRVTLDDPNAAAQEEDDLCMDGTPWPKTPEEIERYVREMDETPGLEMTDEEYARWEADRLARKAQGIADNERRMERIMAMFE